MDKFIKRLLALAIIFILTYFIAVGAKTYLSQQKGIKNVPYKSETYTFLEKSEIADEGIELLNRLDKEFTHLAENAVQSVVSIHTSARQITYYRDFFGRVGSLPKQVEGQGSGAIITEEGHIVTNAHVVKGFTEFTVVTNDGVERNAELVGVPDELLDIAVLKILDEGTYQPMAFADSDEVSIGQQVLAIGNPLGLGESISKGIISAKNRSYSDTSPNSFQTDAAINRGNSGGPLVNLKGEIVGINVAISTDGSSAGWIGIGFSIPSNDVKQSVTEILEQGRPIRGYLGVNLGQESISAHNAKQLNLSSNIATYIVKVIDHSPAHFAGIKDNDILLEIDDLPVTNVNKAITLIKAVSPGQQFNVKIWREGKELTLHPIAGERDLVHVSILLGLQLGTAQQDKTTFVKVEAIQKGSLADKANLSAGDILIEVNGKTINSISDLAAQFSGAKGKIPMVITRNGKRYQTAVIVP